MTGVTVISVKLPEKLPNRKSAESLNKTSKNRPSYQVTNYLYLLVTREKFLKPGPEKKKNISLYRSWYTRNLR